MASERWLRTCFRFRPFKCRVNLSGAISTMAGEVEPESFQRIFHGGAWYRGWDVNEKVRIGRREQSDDKDGQALVKNSACKCSVEPGNSDFI